jgi:hypothetical protein
MNRLLSGGSKKTLEFARHRRRPHLHLCAADTNIAESLKAFVQEYGIKVLNVAGPRASKEPGVGEFVVRTLGQAFAEMAPGE